MKINVKRIGNHDLPLPEHKSNFAAGVDLMCCENLVTVKPFERAVIRTGVAFEIPPGYFGRIAPRSGLAVKVGIDVLAGIIDADYRGEVQVVLINFGENDVTFLQGDRIAQLLIQRIETPSFVEVNELQETLRGNAGFGSTGV